MSRTEQNEAEAREALVKIERARRLFLIFESQLSDPPIKGTRTGVGQEAYRELCSGLDALAELHGFHVVFP